MSVIDEAIGPRKVGGRYRCAYWAQEYTVVAIQRTLPAGDWRRWAITVEWADGHRTTHGTAWDPKRDKVISQPN